MEIVLPPQPPIQSLMEYVFDNYGNFGDFCVIEHKSKDTAECVECHHKSYYSVGSRRYECDNFKKVYLTRFLARQFEQSDFLIKEHLVSEIAGKTHLSAVSLGGGPAPEALALMNGLSCCEGDYNLSFENIEREASWESVYRDLTRRFVKEIKNVKLRTAFDSSDVTSYVSEKHYDIVFISWLFSDMHGQKESNILQVASDLVKPRGYVLIMDFKGSSLVEVISRLVEVNQGLTLLEHESEHEFNSSVSYPDEIFKIFGPHRSGQFAYWVLQRSLDDIPF